VAPGSRSASASGPSRSRTALTQRLVDKLRAKGGRLEVWDSSVIGLGLRVYSGRASYVVRHKPKGKPRERHTLGDAAVLALADAREQAARVLAESRLGLGAGKAISVKKLLDHFEENHRTRRKGRKPKDDRDTARRCTTLRDRWGSLSASELTHVDVAKLLAEITERGAPYEANRMRALIRLAWNMARRWGFVPTAINNPAEGTPSNREQARDVRALKPAEMKRLLAAAERYPNPWVGAAIKLAVFTGCRIGELVALRWREVDTDAAMIVLRDRKGGDTLALPINSAAVDLLDGLPRQAGSPWVFPSRDPSRHIVDLRKAWATIIAEAELPAGTRVHDMRAAVATNVAAISGLKAAKLVLGQADERTTMRYVRPASEDIRRALDAHGRAVQPRRARGRKAGLG
jgi:integrase